MLSITEGGQSQAKDIYDWWDALRLRSSMTEGIDFQDKVIYD